MTGSHGAASGPLMGIRVVEMAGIGPAPFCGMLLSDLGADVIRVDRAQATDLGLPLEAKFDCTARGRSSVTLDLKQDAAKKAVLQLAEKADVLIEGFRPGVMERLGLGPDELLARNPRLVVGRVTGWGQTGPLAAAAGHDLNYIAITGALAAIGKEGARPTVPLNLVGDYGGGAIYLAFGAVCALFRVTRSGKGQVVDAAMVDGAASMMGLFYGRHAAGLWSTHRGDNELDGGAPWYDTYGTADGKHIAIGSIEPKFFRKLLEKIEADPKEWPAPVDRACWSALREMLAKKFAAKPRAEWYRIFEGIDACYAPVLDIAEAPHHPHNTERGTFIEIGGVMQPAPAPRFSTTPGRVQGPAPEIGEGGEAALRRWGYDGQDLNGLKALGMGWSLYRRQDQP